MNLGKTIPNFRPGRYGTAQLGKTLKMKARDTCEVPRRWKRGKSQVL